MVFFFWIYEFVCLPTSVHNNIRDLHFNFPNPQIIIMFQRSSIFLAISHPVAIFVKRHRETSPTRGIELKVLIPSDIAMNLFIPHSQTDAPF